MRYWAYLFIHSSSTTLPHTFFENLPSAFLVVEVVTGTGKMVLFSVRITCCLCSADIDVSMLFSFVSIFLISVRTGYRCWKFIRCLLPHLFNISSWIRYRTGFSLWVHAALHPSALPWTTTPYRPPLSLTSDETFAPIYLLVFWVCVEKEMVNNLQAHSSWTKFPVFREGWTLARFDKNANSRVQKARYGRLLHGWGRSKSVELWGAIAPL